MQCSIISISQKLPSKKINNSSPEELPEPVGERFLSGGLHSQFSMEIKGIVGLFFAVLAAVPLVYLGISAMQYGMGAINATTFSDRFGQAVVDVVTPWWVPILEWGVPGAVIFIVVVLIFGKKAL